LTAAAARPARASTAARPRAAAGSVQAADTSNEGLSVWLPNWPSMAVTCGIAGQWSSGMIVDRDGTTAIFDLPTSHGLAGTTRTQRAIQKRGNSCAPTRGHRVTPPGQQTATVLGGSSGVRGTDPIAVPGLPITSDPHPGHHLAVAPRPGEATLDPARRHRTNSRRAAPELRRLVLRLATENSSGLPAHPR
jgi:hypothetical protein